MESYPFFEVEKKPDIKTAILYLNRPDKLNAMNWPFWGDLPKVIADLEDDPEVRVVIVAGRGKSFSVGIDVFEFFMQYQDILAGATPERREQMYELLLRMQEGFNRMADGNKIYIAAIHRHCIGAGLDLAAACDLRLASQDAVFSLRETRIAIVADMGSINRLPKIIGQGHTRMLALTGRDISAAEAHRIGLINELYADPSTLMEGALSLAAEITANAEPAVRGTKKILKYMEDHNESDGLRYVATWNSAFFNTREIQGAVQRLLSKPKA
jgi:enoyl-CoA hydratase